MTDAVEYPDLVVVGAGLFGLTVAQQAVEHLGVRPSSGPPARCTQTAGSPPPTGS